MESDMGSAMHRVLALPELLEQILRHTPCNEDGYLSRIEELFVLQMVNRTFRDVIKGSVTLRKLIGLEYEGLVAQDSSPGSPSACGIFKTDHYGNLCLQGQGCYSISAGYSYPKRDKFPDRQYGGSAVSLYWWPRHNTWKRELDLMLLYLNRDPGPWGRDMLLHPEKVKPFQLLNRPEASWRRLKLVCESADCIIKIKFESEIHHPEKIPEFSYIFFWDKGTDSLGELVSAFQGIVQKGAIESERFAREQQRVHTCCHEYHLAKSEGVLQGEHGVNTARAEMIEHWTKLKEAHDRSWQQSQGDGCDRRNGECHVCTAQLEHLERLATEELVRRGRGP